MGDRIQVNLQPPPQVQVQQPRTPLYQETFGDFYVNALKNIGYEKKAILSQLNTTFAYEPIDRLSDEIERLRVTNEALTQPVQYMNNRLASKIDIRENLNRNLNDKFHYYMDHHSLTAKRAKALALIDTDAMFQTQQLVSELKYPSDLAVMAESRLSHKTRAGDGIRNTNAADDMVIDT